jgi:hypothetical protein
MEEVNAGRLPINGLLHTIRMELLYVSNTSLQTLMRLVKFWGSPIGSIRNKDNQ